MPRLPGYVLERELGRGGMGVVYLAWHLGLARHVAIKTMLAGAHASDDDLRRFQAEILAVARFHHPNIVQIHDVGTHDGLPFCVLEYLGGGSLSDRLTHTSLPPRRAAALLIVLARAVEAAHEQGIVHRDLKPGNVMFPGDASHSPGVEWDPRDARITDFGIAKHLDNLHGLTATDSILGTPAYMAPEQASGKSREVGPRADIYSLGAILYECLTGRPPFTGPSAVEILPQVLRDDPLPPSRLVGGVPRDLETICLQCLEKDPARRYPTVQALLDDLECYIDGRPISARPTSPLERGLRWARRNPTVALLLAALTLAIGAGFAGVTYQWRQAAKAHQALELSTNSLAHAFQERLQALDLSETQTRQAEAARGLAERERQDALVARGVADHEKLEAERSRQIAEAARRSAETHLGYSQVAQASMLLERNELAHSKQLLRAVPPEQRGWEWHYLMGQTHSWLASAEHSSWPLKLATSPDGQWATVAAGYPPSRAPGSRSPVVIYHHRLPSLTRSPHCIEGCEAPLRHFGYLQDGRFAIIDARQHVLLLEPTTHAIQMELSPPAFATDAWLSADGRWLARSFLDHQVLLYDLKTGRPAGRLIGHPRPLRSVVFAPEGDTVVTADDLGHVRIWDLTSQTVRQRILHTGQWVSLSPDGRWLAAHHENTHLRVLAMETGRVVWTEPLSQYTGAMHGPPIFSPDSRWLVTCESRSDPRVWSTQSGKRLAILADPDGTEINSITSLWISPDSCWAATTGTNRKLRLWDLAQGTLLRTYAGHTTGILDGVFAASGRQFVTVGGGPNPGDNALLLWDLTRDPRVWREPVFHRRVTQGELANLLAFDPQGQLYLGHAGTGVEVWDDAGVRCTTWPMVTYRPDWYSWHSAALSDDGRYLAGIIDHSQFILFIDTRTGTRQRFNSGVPVRTLALSPDGRLLAVATYDGWLVLYDTASRVRVYHHAIGQVFRLRFSPDSRRLAIGGNGLACLDLDGMRLNPIAPWFLPGPVVGLAFQPGSPCLACTTETAGLITLVDLEKRWIVRQWSEPRILGDVAFHPQGNRLAVASREGIITLYDAATGKEVLTLQGRTGREMDRAFPPRVAFSPDGRRLAATDYTLGLWIWEADPPDTAGDAQQAEHLARADRAAIDFHIRSALDGLEFSRPAQLAFHFDQVHRSPLAPGRQSLERARLLARQRDWAGAAADYRRWLRSNPIAELVPAYGPELQECAAALLLAGDLPTYHTLVRDLRAVVGLPHLPILVRLASWGPGPLPPEYVTLARRACGLPTAKRQDVITVALCLFRSGQHREACGVLENVMGMPGDDAIDLIHTSLAMALIFRHEGQTAMEQHWLKNAATFLARYGPAVRSPAGPDLAGWMASEILLRETDQPARPPGKALSIPPTTQP
ncbi:MAG: protein kinase [Gemmataceae bacterium]